MSFQSWCQNIVSSQVDGPTLTAAAAATCLPGASRILLPPGIFQVGTQLKLIASGRISNVVTTPGTARFDLRLNSALGGSTVVFDTLAMPLNVVAKTNVGWWLEALLTVRAIGNGTSANMIGQGTWQSESFIGSPLATVGGNGSIMVPFNTAPAVGGGFDSTIANFIDFFFTQTVTTGSMTLHQFKLQLLN